MPNEGSIYLGDQDITRFPVYKRAQHGIGYLAQEASIFRKMSVEDNIKSVLEFTDKTPDERKKKLEELIAEFGLEKVRKNQGDRLSGGERRRAEIARCLAIDPKFIMLDEPFAGVDPIAVQDIQSIVAQLKYRNIGILITDHNVDETLSITDRAYLLFEGRVLFQGTAEELADNPVVRGSTWVAILSCVVKNLNCRYEQACHRLRKEAHGHCGERPVTTYCQWLDNSEHSRTLRFSAQLFSEGEG